MAGYSIPATTHILPNLYAINMDPELWENPEEFNPDRFLRNGRVYRPEYFIPFSVGKPYFEKVALKLSFQLSLNYYSFEIKLGRRMCLGDILTKMEVFLFLTSLLQQFHLKIPDGEQPPEVASIVSASMAPKPFKVSLVDRSNGSILK